MHKQPKLIMQNLQNVGHYKTLYWGFTHFSKILEYYYYCGKKGYQLQFTLHLTCVLCAFCARFEECLRQKIEGGK